MGRQRSLIFGGMVCLLGGWVAPTAFALTPEEAISLSERSGRPLLAVVTSPTCPPCQLLKANLTTVDSIRSLAIQFVRLEMDNRGAEFRAFLSKYPAEYQGVPMVFVIRPDGASLYGKSGGLTKVALENLLRLGLDASGTPIARPRQRELADDLRASIQHFAEGELLDALKYTETPGLGESFAKSVIELRGMRRTVLDAISNRLVRLDERLAKPSTMYGAAFRLAELRAGLCSGVERETATAMLAHYQRHSQTSLAVTQGIELVNARERERLGELNEAVSSYDRIIALGRASPTADHANQKLAILRTQQRRARVNRSSSL